MLSLDLREKEAQHILLFSVPDCHQITAVVDAALPGLFERPPVQVQGEAGVGGAQRLLRRSQDALQAADEQQKNQQHDWRTERQIT